MIHHMPSPTLTGSLFSPVSSKAKESEGELWCGIDPGVTGALAFLRMGPVRPVIVAVVPMPVTREMKNGKLQGKADYNWAAVAEALRDYDPDYTVIERQWPRPHEGVVSSFKSGGGYQGLLAILATLELRHETVSPPTWKNALGLRGHEKNLSRELALKLLPEGGPAFARKKDHGPAEAALLILWKAKYETSPLARSLGSRGGPRTLELGVATR